ncbi:MAG: DNA cytosine methyltransferase [Rhodothermaceae bacterium]|nr:DNA cytosine methyltransferase [Rhodothermaceae bacterium]MYG69925.1 DNA cytosine methyltransferase [Rhodothermaceae bacterium]MYJ43744.1 DNA cytosine methyltransferase [Rhodothermaceae bacterium]
MRGCDIFCGAGGSSVGARSAGIDMVAGIDMCATATATYAANFPDAHVLTERLEDVNINRFRDQVGEIDILLASPECRNHTCAKGALPRDESSRATAMHIIKYARVLSPRWIVLENVVYMRPWSRYGELKERLRDLGYHLEELLLDASDFGVAQKRRRLFLLMDLEGPPKFKIRRRPGPRKTVKSILDAAGTWNTTPLYGENRAEATLERAKRAWNVLGDLESFLVVYYGSDGSGGWQPLNRPLRTITTVDRFALVEHDGEMWRIRMLQVPELKRAMGFSNEFLLPEGTRRDKVRLLGNGVCPPVMETVVRSLVYGT